MRPYTIEIAVPDGDPEGLKIISKRNWTGQGIFFPRQQWEKIAERDEFKKAGVYILKGYSSTQDIDEGMPTIYIGQSSNIYNRIYQHFESKDFWDICVCFVSKDESLTSSDVQWLEHKLLTIAKDLRRSKIENSQFPPEPNLPIGQAIEAQSYLDDMLGILPLVEINSFQKIISSFRVNAIDTNISINQILPIKSVTTSSFLDTIIVPAQEDGFKAVFLGENKWRAVRIAANKITDIKYIAAYQSSPISAITHYAEVAYIEPYGDGRKYQLVFAGAAKEIVHVPFGDAPSGFMQSVRYANFNKLISAKKVTDIFN